MDQNANAEGGKTKVKVEVSDTDKGGKNVAELKSAVDACTAQISSGEISFADGLRKLRSEIDKMIEEAGQKDPMDSLNKEEEGISLDGMTPEGE